jgi:hypothetical protein
VPNVIVSASAHIRRSFAVVPGVSPGGYYGEGLIASRMPRTRPPEHAASGRTSPTYSGLTDLPILGE